MNSKLKLVLRILFCLFLYASQQKTGMGPIAVLCFVLYCYTFTLYPVFWHRWICWVAIVVVPLLTVVFVLPSEWHPILLNGSSEMARTTGKFAGVFLAVWMISQTLQWIGIGLDVGTRWALKPRAASGEM
jgi:hypothetical protein